MLLSVFGCVVYSASAIIVCDNVGGPVIPHWGAVAVYSPETGMYGCAQDFTGADPCQELCVLCAMRCRAETSKKTSVADSRWMKMKISKHDGTIGCSCPDDLRDAGVSREGLSNSASTYTVATATATATAAILSVTSLVVTSFVL